MTYEQIKSALEEWQYLVFIKKTKSEDLYIMAGAANDEVEGTIGNILVAPLRIGSTFTIFLRNQKIVVSYAIGQIPANEEFITIEELITFITTKFPV